MHNPATRFCAACLSLVTVSTLFSQTAMAHSPEEVLPDEYPLVELQQSAPSAPDAPLADYYSYLFSNPEHMERYHTWGISHPELSAEQVIIQVNIGLDKKLYTDTDIIKQPDSLTALVNKYHALPADYTPELELLGSRYGYGYLRPEAAQAFRAMADAARADGISLRSVSAYRSYDRQMTLYKRYLSQDSLQSVDTYSARPGFSEHQTALTLDINTASIRAGFEKTPAYAWLMEHCAEYGFILRYPKEKEDITGYRYEPWHYRYVGPEVAQICMEQGLTLDEYVAMQPVKMVPVQPAPDDDLIPAMALSPAPLPEVPVI